MTSMFGSGARDYLLRCDMQSLSSTIKNFIDCGDPARGEKTLRDNLPRILEAMDRLVGLPPIGHRWFRAGMGASYTEIVRATLEDGTALVVLADEDGLLTAHPDHRFNGRDFLEIHRAGPPVRHVLHPWGDPATDPFLCGHTAVGATAWYRGLDDAYRAHTTVEVDAATPCPACVGAALAAMGMNPR